MIILMFFMFLLAAATVLTYWKQIAILVGTGLLSLSAFVGLMYVIIVGYVEWLP